MNKGCSSFWFNDPASISRGLNLWSKFPSGKLIWLDRHSISQQQSRSLISHGTLLKEADSTAMKIGHISDHILLVLLLEISNIFNFPFRKEIVMKGIEAREKLKFKTSLTSNLIQRLDWLQNWINSDGINENSISSTQPFLTRLLVGGKYSVKV